MKPTVIWDKELHFSQNNIQSSFLGMKILPNFCKTCIEFLFLLLVHFTRTGFLRSVEVLWNVIKLQQFPNLPTLLWLSYPVCYWVTLLLFSALKINFFQIQYNLYSCLRVLLYFLFQSFFFSKLLWINKYFVSLVHIWI